MSITLDSSDWEAQRFDDDSMLRALAF